MLTALIVDDEPIILGGLSKMIPWENIGIGSVLTAASAREALRIAASARPQIMLTDICMPDIDGLELTRQALQVLPELRVIVLTGYDEFKYAQKCCSLGVKDFLLKPVDEKCLMQSIRNQLDSISEEKCLSLECNLFSRKAMLDRQRQLEDSLELLTEEPMGKAASAAIAAALRCPEDTRYRVAVASPLVPAGSDWKNHGRLLLLSLKNILINLIDSQKLGWTFEKRDGRIVLILFEEGFGDLPAELRKIREMVRNEFDVGFEIGLGAVARGITEIKASYDRAAEALEDTLNGPAEAAPEAAAGLSPRERLALLRTGVLESFGDNEAVASRLKKFLSELKNANLPRADALGQIYGLSTEFYWQFLKNTGSSAEGGIDSLIAAMQSCDFLNCCDFVEMFILRLIRSNKRQMHEIVEAATEYIAGNLGEELTVISLAERYHVARNYFSRLFKKETGEGCNEYITRRRMEMAKRYFATFHLKTYQIAELVGYHDQNYFSLSFKKYTGLCPSDYRVRVNNPE